MRTLFCILVVRKDEDKLSKSSVKQSTVRALQVCAILAPVSLPLAGQGALRVMALGIALVSCTSHKALRSLLPSCYQDMQSRPPGDKTGSTFCFQYLPKISHSPWKIYTYNSCALCMSQTSEIKNIDLTHTGEFLTSDCLFIIIIIIIITLLKCRCI